MQADKSHVRCQPLWAGGLETQEELIFQVKPKGRKHKQESKQANKQNPKPASWLECHWAGRNLPLFLGGSAFLFNWLDRAHPYGGAGQVLSELLRVLIQVFTSSRNTSQTHLGKCLAKCLATHGPITLTQLTIREGHETLFVEWMLQGSYSIGILFVIMD